MSFSSNNLFSSQSKRTLQFRPSTSTRTLTGRHQYFYLIKYLKMHELPKQYLENPYIPLKNKNEVTMYNIMWILRQASGKIFVLSLTTYNKFNMPKIE